MVFPKVCLVPILTDASKSRILSSVQALFPLLFWLSQANGAGNMLVKDRKTNSSGSYT